MSRRFRCLGFGLVAALALAAAGAWSVAAWDRAQALDRARRAVARGDHASARNVLLGLRPETGESALLLGDCEAALARPDAAVKAWERVPETSALYRSAALRRGRVEADRGRFRSAETALTAALRGGGTLAIEAREGLIRILWRQARARAAAGLIEDQWRALSRTGRLTNEAAFDLLRAHLSLDFETFPIDEIEDGLRRIVVTAGDDQGVALALARWEIRAGRLDGANVGLVGCLARRPDDPEVWLVRLDWARAAGRPDAAREAMTHLPADRFDDRDLLALSAWLASGREDPSAERAALERLVTLCPGDLPVVERLAELVHAAGETDHAARLRGVKADLDRAKQTYLVLFKDDALALQSVEMARLAAALGRRFERRAFLTLAARAAPDDASVRAALALSEPSAEPTRLAKPGRTLAERLAADLKGVVDPLPTRAAATSPPRFEDVADAAGLRFRFDPGTSPIHQLPEVMSGGCALIDADGDGWLDVLALQGGPFPPRADLRSGGDRLFRNLGNGTFEDMTSRSGLTSAEPRYSHGVAVGDFNNDGRADLFLTGWRSYALYQNRGDGSFEDVTARAGLGGDRDWPTSAAFADLDGDGDLDLYVCHYLKWDAEHPKLCPSPTGKGHRSCDPRLFEALPDHVFRNDGGRFVDLTSEALPLDRDGRGLGVVAADLDGDGRTDLFVANDGTANYLLRNLGGFRFEEVGMLSGVAGNASGAFQAGMGTAVGDLDGDGLPDLVVTNFYNESTSYFRNLGGGVFADHSAAVGLAASSRSLLGFGVALFDANNDGYLDLATANGHVNDDRPEFPFAMPAQLLTGGPDRRLTAATVPSWAVPRVARGLAVGDLDNDGRLDALIVDQVGPLVYFHNRTAGPSRFLTLRLVGGSSNRDAVGAAVTVTAGGRVYRAWKVGGGSYLSAGDPRLHIGLGPGQGPVDVVIRWPSGRVDRLTALEPGRGLEVLEGDSTPRRLPGFQPR